MYLEQSQYGATQQSQSLNISAKLIASIKILQYSAEELEQAIAGELSENPALEVEEVAHCLRCGSALRAGLCPTCDRAASDTSENLAELAGWEDDATPRSTDLAGGDDRDFDPLDITSTGMTLQEHLLRQLGAIVPDEDAAIAEYLVGSLNGHGYVTVTIAETAEAVCAPEARVAAVLATLQSLDPPGIGARNLRECLLIQLAEFEARGEAPAIARPLLECHIHALGEHHFAEIARGLGVSGGAVKQAWRYIRSNLNPYPAHVFETGDVPGEGLVSSSERNILVRPDVVIRRTEQGFEAEVVERRRFRFDTNALYSTLSQQGRSAGAGRTGLSEDDRQHVRLYASRARFFIDCVRQRWQTLSLIADALIDFQRDFLESGVRALRPLTRGELAAHVGLHESTVSRATDSKYVLLPTGRTVPFDDFFDGSLAAKDQLRELIDGEDHAKPYSDEDLTALLHDRGMPLARRTVAKYREALGILPSRFRI
jgi:RNA polymerase sigma-54 factor